MYTIIKIVMRKYVCFGYRGCNSSIGCIARMSEAIVRMLGGYVIFYMYSGMVA